MSLLDALLLEPAPLEAPTGERVVFVALRNDSQLGSGTAADPYNGATSLSPSLAGTVTFDPLDVIATVPGNVGPGHGFNNGDTIAISKVTGESADSYNQSFSGSNFAKIDDYSFKLRLGAVPEMPPGPPYPTRILATRDSDGKVAEVFLHWPVFRVSTGAVNHGFPQYAVVKVAVSDPANSLLNGDFVAVMKGDDFCWCLLTNPPGSASISDDCTCARIIYGFDNAMSAAPARSRIHIVPAPSRRAAGALFTTDTFSKPARRLLALAWTSRCSSSFTRWTRLAWSC